MVIDREEPQVARHVDIRRVLHIMLDEATTALGECLSGLSDEQLWARPLSGRHAIGTMLMHCIENLDEYGVLCQTGRRAVGVEGFDMWTKGPKEMDAELRGKSLPGVPEIERMLATVRDAALAATDEASEYELHEPLPGNEWMKRFDRTRADAIVRTAMHANAHTRQIWALRGKLDAVDPDHHWPRQLWA